MNNFIIDESKFKDVVINITDSIVVDPGSIPVNILENVVYIEPQNLPAAPGMCTNCFDNPFGIK